ncbi:hypothetical protein L207DRAFT_512545, partial [Hyaloscypha variabilis F]
MFLNGISIIATTIIIPTHSFLSPTGAISSSSRIRIIESSSTSIPTNFAAPTSTTKTVSHPPSRLSIPIILGLSIVGLAVFCTFAFALLCCLHLRRPSFGRLQRSDSELFVLVCTPKELPSGKSFAQ